MVIESKENVTLYIKKILTVLTKKLIKKNRSVTMGDLLIERTQRRSSNSSSTSVVKCTTFFFIINVAISFMNCSRDG
jgi:hypothetical protein